MLAAGQWAGDSARLALGRVQAEAFSTAHRGAAARTAAALKALLATRPLRAG